MDRRHKVWVAQKESCRCVLSFSGWSVVMNGLPHLGTKKRWDPIDVDDAASLLHLEPHSRISISNFQCPSYCPTAVARTVCTMPSLEK